MRGKHWHPAGPDVFLFSFSLFLFSLFPFFFSLSLFLFFSSPFSVEPAQSEILINQIFAEDSSQRFRLIKDGHLPSERGKET